jgi:hypothetical protein
VGCLIAGDGMRGNGPRPCQPMSDYDSVAKQNAKLQGTAHTWGAALSLLRLSNHTCGMTVRWVAARPGCDHFFLVPPCSGAVLIVFGCSATLYLFLIDVITRSLRLVMATSLRGSPEVASGNASIEPPQHSSIAISEMIRKHCSQLGRRVGARVMIT